MQPLQRTATRSVRHIRPQIQRQCRRRASVNPPEHKPLSDAHKSEEQSHGSTNESFGAGFYIALAALPASFAVYKFTHQDENAYFTRLIRDTYDGYKNKWAQRNDLHTQAMEQAAADRVLFLNESAKSPRYVDIRFPEQFNTGSPWNVPAGQGSINIDKVIEKYQKELYEAQEKKLQQIQENKVPVEQPFEPLVKSNAPAV